MQHICTLQPEQTYADTHSTSASRLALSRRQNIHRDLCFTPIRIEMRCTTVFSVRFSPAMCGNAPLHCTVYRLISFRIPLWNQDKRGRICPYQRFGMNYGWWWRTYYTNHDCSPYCVARYALAGSSWMTQFPFRERVVLSKQQGFILYCWICLFSCFICGVP